MLYVYQSHVFLYIGVDIVFILFVGFVLGL